MKTRNYSFLHDNTKEVLSDFKMKMKNTAKHAMEFSIKEHSENPSVIRLEDFDDPGYHLFSFHCT